jgi:hypothetical protein
VVPTFWVPEGGSLAQVTVQAPLYDVNMGGRPVQFSAIAGTWLPRSDESGGFTTGNVGFTYSGPLLNSMRVNLTLYVPVPTNGQSGLSGVVMVDNVTTGCTITRGVAAGTSTFENRTGNNATQVREAVYTCNYWYQPVWHCWGHYRSFYMLFINLLITGTLLVGVVFMFVSVLIMFLRVQTIE